LGIPLIKILKTFATFSQLVRCIFATQDRHAAKMMRAKSSPLYRGDDFEAIDVLMDGFENIDTAILKDLISMRKLLGYWLPGES
jgi:hypothetical protein